MSSETPLPFINPETVKAIRNDPFAMETLKVTRNFLMVAHRDFGSLDKDGKMIFFNDEAGIAWEALGRIMGATSEESKLPSDTIVFLGDVPMQLGHIDSIQKAVRDGYRHPDEPLIPAKAGQERKKHA